MKDEQYTHMLQGGLFPRELKIILNPLLWYTCWDLLPQSIV